MLRWPVSGLVLLQIVDGDCFFRSLILKPMRLETSSRILVVTCFFSAASFCISPFPDSAACCRYFGGPFDREKLLFEAYSLRAIDMAWSSYAL